LTVHARDKAILPGAILATALSVLLLSAFSSASAHSTACSRWGNTQAKSLGLDRARRAILCLVNDRRADHGLRRLHSNSRLHRASQRHSRHMQEVHCFDHRCPKEGGLETRLQKVGYLRGGLSRWAFGENIAWGAGRYSTPRRIVAAWMGSPPHRAIMLSSQFRDVGIGYVKGTPYRRHANAGVYTVDFGMRSW
jgi:uncharacterized protein YkwD